MLDDRDVMRLLVHDQPVQVRPHCVEGVGGHHGAVQVQRFQELGEVAGLVVPDADLEVVRQASAVLGGAEQVDPGAVGAASAAGGLAVHGHGPQPVPGQRLGLLGGAPGTVSAHAGRGRPAGTAAAARARPAYSSVLCCWRPAATPALAGQTDAGGYVSRYRSAPGGRCRAVRDDERSASRGA